MLISFTFITSCSDENETTSNFSNNSLIIPSVGKTITYFNALPRTDHYETNLTVSKQFLIENNNVINNKIDPTIQFSQDLVTDQNLNHLSETVSTNIDIISVTTYTNSSGKPVGIVQHSYFKNEQIMFINVYDIDNNENLTSKEGFPMIVNGVLFEDLNYIGNRFYPTEDIKSVSINRYENYPLEKNYNDLYLSYKTDTYLAEENNYTIDDTSGCSLAVHHCLYSSGRRCFSTGCSDGGCSREGIDNAAYDNNNLSAHHTIINNSIPHGLLYSFKDRLNETILGKKYVEMYYAISEHFIDTIDTSLFIDIAQVSPIVATKISYYMSNNNSQVIIDDQLINEIKNLAEKSKRNSYSTVYKNSLNKFIQEFEKYRGMNATTINNLLTSN